MNQEKQNLLAGQPEPAPKEGDDVAQKTSNVAQKLRNLENNKNFGNLVNKNKIGGMVHKGTARQVQEGPQYIYLAKYSPLCRCMRVSCLSYLVLLVIMSIMLIINTNYCGLDANRHTMRLRNVTYPIAQKGHIETGAWDTHYDELKDEFDVFKPETMNLK